MSICDELERFHKRKSPRLKQYDYAQPNCYFVTICTKEKRCIFGKPDHLSLFGQLAHDAFGQVGAHFPAVNIDKFVVMPNHVHAIVTMKEAGVSLPSVIGHYKAFVTKQIRKTSPERIVWQTSFHDHVIRSQADYERIWRYIDGNPARWEEDCFFVIPDDDAILRS